MDFLHFIVYPLLDRLKTNVLLGNLLFSHKEFNWDSEAVQQQNYLSV